MNIRDNTILITGGATGIGFSLAEEFTKTCKICAARKGFEIRTSGFKDIKTLFEKPAIVIR
jgi:short-subunit dehydrogenase involved in D-alanine esterification of teichoic acids